MKNGEKQPEKKKMELTGTETHTKIKPTTGRMNVRQLVKKTQDIRRPTDSSIERKFDTAAV